MLEGGEDPRFIVRRMVILASEDIGNADPQALVGGGGGGRRRSSTSACPRASYALAQAAIYLALAPKSNAAGKALGAARAHVREHGAQPRPRACAAPARRGGAAGPRRGYDNPHDHPGHVSRRSCCPRASRASASTSPTRPRPRSRERLRGDPPARAAERAIAIDRRPWRGDRSRAPSCESLQPGHRRARWAAVAASRRASVAEPPSTRRRGAAAVGAAAPARPRALHAPRGAGGHRRVRRARRPRSSPSRAARAPRSRSWSCSPAIETLQWLAERRARDPGRRADRLLAHAAPGQARALELRAARRRRRARPGGRAVRHAAGRRRGAR